MKLILLSNSDAYTLLVDDIYDLVVNISWSLNRDGYVQGKGFGGQCTGLHRIVMNAGPNQEVDHINRIKTDNRRSNLRFVTHSENMANYAGVSRHLPSSYFRTVHKNCLLCRCSLILNNNRDLHRKNFCSRCKPSFVGLSVKWRMENGLQVKPPR